jgi:hypothetical protein
VTINVNAVDDAPDISADGFILSEDALNGTAVGTVTTNEVDGDTLSYAITAGNQSGAFSIDSQTGELQVADDSQIDYETQTQYSLTVSVTDATVAALSDSATITIDVTDVNDNAPVLTANSLTLSENDTVTLDGSNLAATDADSDDPFLSFTVSSVSGGEFQVSGVPQTTFTQSQITASQVAFVHDGGELAPSYSVTVDDGELSSGPNVAVITFSNVNDNAPIIPVGQSFTVSEDASNGTLVGVVSFSDDDLPGDTLTASIIGGNSDGVFAIDDSGNLDVVDNTNLNFDVTSVYALTVEVFDGVNASSQLVTVDVLDVADGTKFFVAQTAGQRMFEYDADGTHLVDNSLANGNGAPRGVAADATGTTLWVVDDDDHIYVYDTDSSSLGEWEGLELSRPEGIATDGQDIWVVDRSSDRVYRYNGAVSQTSGSRSADSNFKLHSSNKNPKGITTDGTHLWVVQQGGTDRVFKYTVSGTYLGYWNLDSANTRPEGITIDPLDVNTIWTVDRETDSVFQYTGGAHWVSGSHSADAEFDLAAGNHDPRGIADPPSPDRPLLDTRHVQISPQAADLAAAQPELELDGLDLKQEENQVSVPGVLNHTYRPASLLKFKTRQLNRRHVEDRDDQTLESSVDSIFAELGRESW